MMKDKMMDEVGEGMMEDKMTNGTVLEDWLVDMQSGYKLSQDSYIVTQ